MKKLLLLGLILVLTLSCQNAEQRYFTSSPEIDSLKELVSYYENGNWEKWMTHYADTAKIYHNTTDGVSASETQQSLKEILSNVSSYKFDEKPIFYEMIIDDEGEKWVYFWANWRGTLAANNQELVIPVHLAVNMVDGLIAEEYGYYDVSRFMAALSEIDADKESEFRLDSQ